MPSLQLTFAEPQSHPSRLLVVSGPFTGRLSKDNFLFPSLSTFCHQGHQYRRHHTPPPLLEILTFQLMVGRDRMAPMGGVIGRNAGGDIKVKSQTWLEVNPMFSLVGKLAVVTSSSCRIGAAIALRLAEEGATVAVNYANSSFVSEKKKIVSTIIAQGKGDDIAIKANVSTPKAQYSSSTNQ
ncbi:hypothetical protein D9758_015646 [Tetrapyrgos nigripes]|uniref:Uncharacterized protein n=1 Tax=Tetrapyrgos nigripes TaxID=182062 RepID=A0A8H5CKJ8_9AGAR|nr:hypothetical protein D9758_015646 [Tetrapyrgos nigripes]